MATTTQGARCVMRETNRNPNIYTPPEAAEYLGVTEAQLPWLENHHKLPSWPAGKLKVYWKSDLDVCAYRLCGLRPPVELIRKQGLNLAQESA